MVVELHVFDDLAYVAKSVLEAFVADISVASRGIRVTNVWVVVIGLHCSRELPCTLF